MICLHAPKAIHLSCAQTDQFNNPENTLTKSESTAKTITSYKYTRLTPNAFSLIELLIVLSVATLLLTLLMPGLSKLREASWHVACAHNQRQIAIAMSVYADDNDERLPYTYFAGEKYKFTGKWKRVPQPFKMMTLYMGNNSTSWDGIGLLTPKNYVNNPKIYYCPAHRGEHPFDRYADKWAQPGKSEIIGNYHYRGLKISDLKFDKFAISDYALNKLQINSANLTILSDGLKTKNDFSHKTGTNVVRADLSVNWFDDTKGAIYNKLPDEDQYNGHIKDIWHILDSKMSGS